MLGHLDSKALRDLQVSQVHLAHLETWDLLVILDSQGHQVHRGLPELRVHQDQQGMQFLDHQDLQASLDNLERQVLQEEGEKLASQAQLVHQDHRG